MRISFPGRPIFIQLPPGLPTGKAVRLHDRAPLRETGQQVPEGPPQLQGGLLQEEMEKDH